MTPETFLEHFELFAEAPNGVERLRRFILALAVKGNLVKQNPNDESGEELLRRLMRSSGTATQTKLSSILESSKHEPPYQVPTLWTWARFDQVATIESNLVHPDEYRSIPHVAPDNIEKATGRLLDYRSVKEDGVRSNNHLFFPGQILYSKIRPNLSKAVLVDFSGLCSADMYPIRASIDSRYLLSYILSSTFLGMAVRNDTRVAMPKINQTELNAVLVAVPPLAEQRRIVAKVDELMGLCDELEAKQKAKREGREMLLSSALDKLLSARDASEFATHWQRLRDNFDLLFDTPATIPHLRQAILTIAAQGKLVPQKQVDEPATAFFTRLQKERKATSKKAGASLVELNPVNDETLVPFPIPSSWIWVRLGDFGGFLGGGTPSKQQPEYWTGDVPWVSPKDMKRAYIDDAIDHVSLDAIENSSTKLIPPNSLLMVVRGMILIHSFPVALTTREVTINQDMKALLLAIPETGEYLLRCCRAAKSRILASIERSSHGTCRLSTEGVANTLIPLPPLAEQHRIVAKVDELMGLCDELESRLTQSETNAESLLSASVAQLLQA